MSDTALKSISTFANKQGLMIRNICLSFIAVLSLFSDLINGIFNKFSLLSFIGSSSATFLVFSCLGAVVLSYSGNTALKNASNVLVIFLMSRICIVITIGLTAAFNDQSLFGEISIADFNIPNLLFYIFVAATFVAIGITVLSLLENIRTNKVAMFCGISFAALATLNLFTKGLNSLAPNDSQTGFFYKVNLPFTVAYIVVAAILMVISQSEKFVFWPALFIGTVSFLYLNFQVDNHLYEDLGWAGIIVVTGVILIIFYSFYELLRLNPNFNLSNIKKVSEKIIKPYEED